MQKFQSKQEAVRKAGVLLHITSLPNDSGHLGCLDENAWKFVDWLAEAGFKTWQLLPHNHPHSDGSPYNSVSAFAMNPAFLPANWQDSCDDMAFNQFLDNEPFWLNDYALFMSIREEQGLAPWQSWPKILKFRKPQALQQFAEMHAEKIRFIKQQQFCLLTLWQSLRAYANSKSIELFGDIPIFVAFDSADVWASPEQFLLDDELNPPVVAGVPPDYFSETGQRWGNPHYNWEFMIQDDFAWWMRRLEHSLSLYDLVRIDHFRGLQACWHIDAEEETALNGQWVEVPGDQLLAKVQQRFPEMPIVAEDLGLITPEVVALKQAFALPGMSILQFGFNGLPDNPHALNEQVENSVAYTGTHDNDTTIGWFESLDNDTKHWVWSSLQTHLADADVEMELPKMMPWPLVTAGALSVAQRVIYPMQDLLMLNGEHRMNVPGIADGNWGWQFQWSQVPASLANTLRQMLESTGRTGSSTLTSNTQQQIPS